SVRQEDAPQLDFRTVQNRFPVLGVCYGAQYMAQHAGGEVKASTTREYGRAHLKEVKHTNPLLVDIPVDSQVWMSHADTISTIPEDFDIIASTDQVRVAAYQVRNTKTYGIQFHPEVTYSTDGSTLLKNF